MRWIWIDKFTEFTPRQSATAVKNVSLARDAVFYLDPHVCTRCRYRSTELLWQCPQCHEWNTFIEERITPVTKRVAAVS